MKKCLIFSPSYKIWGGGQIYIEQLNNFLIKKGVESYILTAEPESFNTQTKKMNIVRSKKTRLLEAIKIAKKYKKKNFKNIILNDLSSLWLSPIFKFYGFNVISLLHLYLQKKSKNPLGHNIIEYYLQIYSSKFCDYIFSVNKNNIEVFGDRVKFIGNYVPDWFFKCPKKNKKLYDFIIIARLAKQKNIPLFLEVLHNLNKRGHNCNLLIIGEGPEKNNILKRICELNLGKYVQIESWAKRENLPSKYDLGKIFVISSFHEGFATTLLEAHSRGLPAIVTKSSGFCGEFVEGYNAKTGIVFQPQDLKNEDFYNQLINLVKNYRKFETLCIEKAKIFSEEKVLNPIYKVLI